MRKLCIVILIIILIVLVLPLNESFADVQDETSKMNTLKNMIIQFVQDRMLTLNDKKSLDSINVIIDIFQKSKGLCMVNNKWENCDDNTLAERNLIKSGNNIDISSRIKYFDSYVEDIIFSEENPFNINKISEGIRTEFLKDLSTQLQLVGFADLEDKSDDQIQLEKIQTVQLMLIFNNLYYLQVVPNNIESSESITRQNKMISDIRNAFIDAKQAILPTIGDKYVYDEDEYKKFIKKIFFGKYSINKSGDSYIHNINLNSF